TATFTPTASITDTTNLITLSNTGVADLAGNTGSGITDSNNYAIDTARPTVGIVVADAALSVGETTLVTFTFSEAVTGFDNTDLAIANGTLGALGSVDGGITWTATFTPTANVTDTTNLITLANTGVADLAGNTGAGTTDSNNYAIDTARPTVGIVVADAALSVGETTLVTFTFSEAVTGFDNTDLTIANGTLGAVSSSDGGITWTATFTPTANVTDTTNLITLANTGIADLAGNTGSGTTDSNNYAIDTARPTVGIVVADAALSAGETTLVTFTFSEAVTGFDNTDLAISNGSLAAVSSLDGGITWTATFTPTANVTDTSNLITLTNTGIADLAGNTGSGTTDSNNYAIDTARPTVGIVVADAALSVGETTLVTFTFSEAVTGFDNTDLTIANGTLGAVGSVDGGITWTATFTPTANVTDTTNLITLANTGIADLAGNTGAGTTDSNNYAIDTARPTVGIVVADAALSVGETTLVTFTFSEAVTGFDNTDLAIANGTLGAVGTTDGGITWTATFTPTANVTDTTNLITLANTGIADLAGNTGSGTTDSNNYAIDTARPTVGIVVADAALSAGETTLVTFTFSEAVTGFDNTDLAISNGSLAAVSSLDGGITWTATFTPTANVTDTSNLITLTNTGIADLAGNTGSGTTDSNNYAIDTARPTVGIVVADAALSVGETTLVTFTFSEAVTGFDNTDLTIANGTLGAVGSVDGGITWTATFTPTANVTDTTNLITLANTGIADLAGNTGAGTTDSNNYAIDTARPTVGIVVADAALSVGETTLVTFTFSEAVTGFDNTDLAIANGTLGAVGTTDGGITWTATFTPTANVTDTSNLITLANTGIADLAGNTGSGTTDSNNYAIDTARPTATISIADDALAAGEDSLVTVTFSEAVTGFTNADLSVANGTLATLASVDGGITWTATFTPAADTEASGNLIVLANTGLTDLAGNSGSGTTDSNGYAIDTLRPTATIVISDSVLSTGETALVTITFSEAVSGLTNADLSVANGTLGAVGSIDGGVTWTATFTPGAQIADASNVITLGNSGPQDAAGNNTGGSTDSNNYAVETSAPTAAIVVADSSLTAGETSLVTITFSEPVTGFTNADLSVANGTLGALSSLDGGITWTAMLTPASNLRDASNVITLDNSGLTDLLGNAGSGLTDSNNYAIATVRPGASVVVADSTLLADETSLVSITFSEAVSGFDNADLNVANGTLGAVSSQDGGITWTAILTPDAGIADGSNQITLNTAGVVNADGNAGLSTVGSNNYTVDTARPGATIVLADTSLSAGETTTVTITFTEPVTGFGNADLTVANGTLGPVSSTDGGLTWSATFTPAANTIAAANAITLDLGGVQDAAGNSGVGSASAGYAIDTQTPGIAISSSLGALRAGQSSTITFTLTEAVNGFDAGDVLVSGGTLSNFSGGGTSFTATFTPSANNVSGASIRVNAGAFADAAGNANAASNSLQLAVDTRLPTLTITSSDNLLMVGETALLTFTLSEASTDFTIADISVSAGTLSEFSGSGTTYTARLTPPPSAPGGSSVTVGSGRFTDAAGNPNTAAFGVFVAVDTIPAIAPSAPTLSLASDTGSSNTDRITSVNTPVVNGTASAGTTITLFDTDGVTVLGSTVATGGAWSITSAALADGTHSLTVVATKNGANPSASSAPMLITVDGAPPSATVSVADDALAAGETSLVTITFSEPVTGFTNADLTVANGSLGALSSLDGGTTWSATFTPTANTTDASNLVTLANAGVQDVAGNAGAGSTVSNNYAIDTARPTASIVVADSALSVGETSLVTITFSEAVSGLTNADLTVANGTLGAVGSLDGGVTWTATFTPTANVADASNLVTLANGGVQDAAGNAGTGITNSNNYAVDTAPAATPGTPQLSAASDSGRSNSDRVTNDSTPTVTGSAADGSTITLFDSDGVTVLGSAVATGGVWSITSTALADGSHNLTVVATKNGLNPSARSSALQVTIDSVAPAAPGTPATADGPVTHNRTPVFFGSGAEADSVITIRSGTTALGTALANAAGNWSADPITLAGGLYAITTSATDVAGNTSAASAPLALRIAAPPPQAQSDGPKPNNPNPELDEFKVPENVAPIGLAVMDGTTHSPLAATIAKTLSNGAFVLPGYGNVSVLASIGGTSAGPAFELELPVPLAGINANFTIPASLFGSLELVSLRATLPGGEPLPIWLTFDPVNRTFSGEVPPGALSTLTIEVIGTDAKGKEHRATITLSGAKIEPVVSKAPPALLQGIDLLVALGLKGGERGAITPRPAPAGPGADGSDAAPARSHRLSDHLAQHAQRFAHNSDATLRHLEQVERAHKPGPQA
ncbi:Ig-like domain-containing protein, partial [Massilia glaciei]